MTHQIQHICACLCVAAPLHPHSVRTYPAASLWRGKEVLTASQCAAGLGIPLGSETVTLSAPCSVSLGRSQGGCRWPDLRINLLQLTIGRPGNTLAAHSGTRTACGAWFCSPTRLAAHTASLALAYLLMPDLVRPRIGQVAPAGWLAFGGPLVWQGLGFGSGQRVPAKDVATDGPSGQHSSTTGGATEQPTSHKRARKWHRPCQAVTKAVQLITGALCAPPCMHALITHTHTHTHTHTSLHGPRLC